MRRGGAYYYDPTTGEKVIVKAKATENTRRKHHPDTSKRRANFKNGVFMAQSWSETGVCLEQL